MSYKRKTCICGHNKRAHEYYYGCNRCLSFKKKKSINKKEKK